MSEYDLKKSERSIGQLYPILEANDGEIIDGVHREQADKNWRRVRLEHIDTEEKKLVARLVANFNRRVVPWQEKKDWINDLAKIYIKQGLKVLRNRNEVKLKIVEVTGLTERTVSGYLSPEFKVKPEPHLLHGYRISASERIEHDLGKEYAERHREEVIAEEKPKIEKDLKLKLVKNPEFQREVLRELRRPKFTKPSEPCPSGVCELPPVIKAGEPVDVVAERMEQFFIDNPDCLCKTCKHYESCGVIR